MGGELRKAKQWWSLWKLVEATIMTATAASDGDGDSDDKRFDVLFLYLSPSSVLRSCRSTSRLRHRRCADVCAFFFYKSGRVTETLNYLNLLDERGCTAT
ncbi:uncharacterized protein G2W53_014281 [Senna tora]|uniref:Secreted protein n=1 Tax=Senna tora TaxID=362788 RepID=A0A834WT76_9FABA|nr:uncharacterized protein G2W53_014281 [Senna tora]